MLWGFERALSQSPSGYSVGGSLKSTGQFAGFFGYTLNPKPDFGHLNLPWAEKG